MPEKSSLESSVDARAAGPRSSHFSDVALLAAWGASSTSSISRAQYTRLRFAAPTRETMLAAFTHQPADRAVRAGERGDRFSVPHNRRRQVHRHEGEVAAGAPDSTAMQQTTARSHTNSGTLSSRRWSWTTMPSSAFRSPGLRRKQPSSTGRTNGTSRTAPPRRHTS